RALLLRGQRRFGGAAHLEREEPFAAGRLVERRLEPVRVGLVGQVLVRNRQREREHVALDRLQFRLRGELRGDRRQRYRRDERGPVGRILRQRDGGARF